MKKTALALCIVFMGIIIFFTAFGEKLYYASNPGVTLYTIYESWMDTDFAHYTIPKERIMDGCVYVLDTPIHGFSEDMYTVKACQVSAFPNPGDSETVLISRADVASKVIVISTTKKLSDGARAYVLEDDY